MRRLFLPACVVSVVCLIAQVASLLHAEWVSPDHSTRIILQRGSLRVWVGAKDDWVAFKRPYGLQFGGWTGAPIWTPSLTRDARIWVPSAPVAAGSAAPVIAKQIRGVEAIVPWYLPLLAAGGASALLYFPWRRARRVKAGLCGACGYDLTGVSSRCPECGTVLARLLAVLRAWLRPA